MTGSQAYAYCVHPVYVVHVYVIVHIKVHDIVPTQCNTCIAQDKPIVPCVNIL